MTRPARGKTGGFVTQARRTIERSRGTSPAVRTMLVNLLYRYERGEITREGVAVEIARSEAIDLMKDKPHPPPTGIQDYYDVMSRRVAGRKDDIDRDHTPSIRSGGEQYKRWLDQVKDQLIDGVDTITTLPREERGPATVALQGLIEYYEDRLDSGHIQWMPTQCRVDNRPATVVAWARDACERSRVR